MMIQYFNPETRCVVLCDGTSIDMVQMFDQNGNETDDADVAVSCVAGPDPDGQWYSISLLRRIVLH